MSDWDGKDRRSDWLERDRLLSDVHSDVKHMVEWTKTHTQSDDNRHSDNLDKFNKIDNTLESLKEFKWKSTAIVGAILICINLFFNWAHK